MSSSNRMSFLDAGVEDGINVTVLIKENGERFVFIFDKLNEESIRKLLETLTEFKNDEDIDFDALDEALIREKVSRNA